MKTSIVPIELIENRIYIIRGQRVMLDQDLAFLYGVETKALNRAVNRNMARFPKDFAFHLTDEEWNILKYQIGTSKTGSGGKHKLPRMFSEYGAYAAAFVLRSPHAHTMSIEIIRTFIRLRRLSATHEALTQETHELKSFVLKHSRSNDREFRKVWNAIEKLSERPNNDEPLGFRLK